VQESGPLRSVLAGGAAIGAASHLTVRFIVEAGSRWLRVEVEVDWHEASRLLKYAVPTRCAGRMARFGTPFGSILRPQLPGYPQTEAMWEVPGNRWAAVLDDAQDSGVAVVTEAKYGFSCRDGELAVTLLRAPMDSSEFRPQRADQGKHYIRFAVGAHYDASDDVRESTAVAAETLFADTVVMPGVAERRAGLALVRPGSLVAAWLAPAEDGRGSILRLHEAAGRSGTAELRVDDPRCRVTAVDLLERQTGTPVRIGAGRWRVDYRPYQVLSFRVVAAEKVAARRGSGRV
jgi:alpha-mannosidase